MARAPSWTEYSYRQPRAHHGRRKAAFAPLRSLGGWTGTGRSGDDGEASGVACQIQSVNDRVSEVSKTGGLCVSGRFLLLFTSHWPVQLYIALARMTTPPGLRLRNAGPHLRVT